MQLVHLQPSQDTDDPLQHRHRERRASEIRHETAFFISGAVFYPHPRPVAFASINSQNLQESLYSIAKARPVRALDGSKTFIDGHSIFFGLVHLGIYGEFQPISAWDAADADPGGLQVVVKRREGRITRDKHAMGCGELRAIAKIDLAGIWPELIKLIQNNLRTLLCVD
jgi:hypothetical protein